MPLPGKNVAPEAHLLSNGHYRALVSGAGAGGSFLGSTALTRWSEDGTRDCEGLFLYIQDLDRGARWSAGHQPVPGTPDSYAALAAPGRVEIHRRDGDIDTRLACCIAPDRDVEIRLLTLTNRSRRQRRLAVTSYVEVALNHPAADAAHPAFSKLFIQTEYLAASQALLARRRPRSPEESPACLAHLLWLDGAGGAGEPEFETDRARFVGRGRTLADPAALASALHLSGTTGNVLDPILAIRREVLLAPGASVRLVALLGAGSDRNKVAELITPATAQAAPAIFTAAERRERELLERLAFAGASLEPLPRLTGGLAYGAERAVTGVELPAAFPPMPAGLRDLGLSGTAPLVLLRVAGERDHAAAVQLARIAEYWRAQGLTLDLLIEQGTAGSLDLPAPARLDRGVTVARTRQSQPDPLVQLASRAARLVLDGAEGLRLERPPALPPARARFRPVAHDELGTPLPANEVLREFNGHGGFSADGREYVIRLPRRRRGLLRPPLAWANVIANEEIGCLTTDSGAGYTWSANSRENRLTPWSNDPVSDPAGEALYLRDEAAGVFWSPTPGPAPGAGDYEVRHGFGYSITRHRSQELHQEVLTFVPRHDGVKLVRLRVTNQSQRRRKISATAYAEWVLGVLPQDTRRFVTTRFDQESGALVALNPCNGEFAHRVAFAAFRRLDVAARPEWTADRRSFLGVRGSVIAPLALQRDEALDGRAGQGMDPCAAFQLPLLLAPGEQAECLFLLGQADDLEGARALLGHYRDAPAVAAALAEAERYWQDLLGRVQVETPSPAIDLMLNGWLAYQNLACRVWGRSAFYQSGGAYGFRDQLQDAGALIYLDPALTRRQILLHAAHQFPEGDVLHWWHPPLAKGIRTRFSDDLLWLPYVTLGYLKHTGDLALLDQPAPFVTSRNLAAGEDEIFVFPEEAGSSASVYQHCCLALDRSLTRGAHGIPLIGTGDWNDGMNRVGREGKGESVWLGFFLYQILAEFIPLCEQRGDTGRAERYRTYLGALLASLNQDGWDGNWYRRAWYDDGAPLGSSASDECRIDAIAQAWSVLSGAAPPERAARALEALERHLVDEDTGIIRLLTPAFDRTPHDPGYIKGYLPGVRENGGQYTHGALWAVRAFAEAGRRERAAALLEMLSPVRHGGTAAAVATYQVEPYVIAADVYGVAPHLGRGGWTWYTGSAGWMFRVGLESILGLTVADNSRLLLSPCIPAAWPGFTLRYRRPGDGPSYEIIVRQFPGERTSAMLDGTPLTVSGGAVVIPLAPGGAHRVEVRLGPDAGPRYEPRTAPDVRITSA